MKIRKLIAAAFLATAAVSLAGCSAQVVMDDETGAVEINGIAANDLIDMFGLDYSYEVSFDPDSGDIAINGITIDGITGLSEEADEEDADEEEDDKEADDEDEYDGEETDDEDADHDDSFNKEADIFENCGVSLTLPGDFDDLLGMFYRDYETIGDDNGIFVVEYGYMGVPEEWFDSLEDLDEISEEEAEKLYGSCLELPYIWTVKKTDGVSGIMEAAEDEMFISLKEDCFTKVGEAGDYCFYSYFDPDQENSGNLGRDFEEEYEKLCSLLEDAIEDAKFYEPVGESADV